MITDDLGAGALAGAGIDEGEAAVGAARAGADLLLFALTDGTAAADALARRDPRAASSIASGCSPPARGRRRCASGSPARPSAAS